jgi:hypothetical protein
MRKFFNTTNHTGKELFDLNKKAKAQEHQVYALFTDENSLTSLECFQLLEGDYLETSVRRCISNLKKAGKLVKTKERRKGNYGVNLVVWIKA